MLYGLGFPFMTTVDSIYGVAFQYADKAFNGSSYTGDLETMSDPLSTAAVEYVQAVSAGAKPLPFLLYVPQGLGQVLGKAMPNVEETADPRRVLRVEFGGGKEVW